jgi:hypothetical protein
MTSSYTSTATLPISSFESDKNICEAIDCDNLATTQIEVEAGKYGIIPLNLCIDCVPLFEVNQNNPKFKQKIDGKPWVRRR